MITTNLTGNFGNHMWYYSICRIVAEMNGFDWGINPIPTHDYYNGQSQLYFMNIDYGKSITIKGKNERGLNTYFGIENEYYDLHKDHEYNGNRCLVNMYDPKVFDIKDNTMVHLISQSEDYLIDRKVDVKEWFKIKQEYKIIFDNKLNDLKISLDENLCIINFRGGEYKIVSNLIVRSEYWRDSINYMLSINPNMKFLIITDDPQCAIHYIGNYPCIHDEIGFDFYAINQSKYVILSNSSFGWWAAWLSNNSKLTIAPKYWGRHNVSNGYWSLGDSYTRCFKYMDREGNLSSYEQCREEALTFYKKNNMI